MRARKLCCIAVCALIALTSGCAAEPTAFPLRDGAVYAAALDSLFATADVTLRDRAIVLQDSTQRSPQELSVEYAGAFYQATDGDSALVANFAERFRTRLSLRPLEDSIRAHLQKPLVMTDEAVAREIAARTDRLALEEPHPTGMKVEAHWKAFFERFPTAVGWVSVSPIGYSRDGGRAVLEVHFGCGGLCGGGNVVVLQRRAGIWKVSRIMQTVVY